MPRYKVAENQQQFDALLSLLDCEGEVAQRAMEVVRMLATNPVLYERVQSLKGADPEAGFSWAGIFDDRNVHKMLYALEVVEAILARDDGEQSLDWLRRFLSLGGL